MYNKQDLIEIINQIDPFKLTVLEKCFVSNLWKELYNPKFTPSNGDVQNLKSLVSKYIGKYE